MRSVRSIALLGACLLGTSVAQAQPAVLISAGDPAQIVEVELAKVAAADSSLWLSVRLARNASLAVVSSAAQVAPAKSADAWLHALDFSTRVRVTPPPGPLAACTDSTGDLADSGFPEPLSLLPSQESTLASEVELRRRFADAGLAVDLARISAFTAQVSPPFRFALYQSSGSVGSTAALRFSGSGPALGVPGIAAAGRDSVPISLLTLATGGVLPVAASVSDPSEFAVRYFGARASTDYVEARGAWLAEDSTRWLVEARASSAFSAYTLIPGAGEIEPALSHYLDALPGQSDARACFVAVQAALARGSRAAADFACVAGDDLQHALAELDFGSIRLTRLFGSIGVAGLMLRTSDATEQSSRVVATDFDARDCPAQVTVPPAPGGSMVPVSTPDPRSASGGPDYSIEESSTDADSAGCTVTVFDDSCSGDSSSSSDASSSDSCSGDSSSDASSSDSCSGDSSSDASSSDSCSGDSSSDASSSDSCSGDSSSDASSSDSCSGDSSGSDSDDSSGCGKSDYDGDTCSGSSESSAKPNAKTSAAWEPSRSPLSSRRPRRVHLSLLTLLAALIALPLRRRKPWRSVVNP